MSIHPDSVTRVLPGLTDELRVYLAGHRVELTRRLALGDDGLGVGRAHALALDGAMQKVFAAAEDTVRDPVPHLSLSAVGSYGRGVVAARSDADVRIVVSPRGRSRDLAAAFAEALLYPLWDAGFSVGHQVVDGGDVLELAREDLATATSLLDLRHVAGNDAVARALVERAWASVFGEGNLRAFLGQLDDETRARHGRFGDSLYLLEPDVKSGPGGLRDLDGARWALRARYKLAEPEPGTAPLRFWGELVRFGVLVQREATEIAQAEEFLWRVRNRLHVHADRRSDRLTFDEQESIAIEMGYAGEGPVTPQRRGAAAERLMQDYYLHARVVTRARERLVEGAMPPLKRRGRPSEVDLGRGVRLFDGHVNLAGTAELGRDPPLALRVYQACVRHGAPIFSFAREAIARTTADPNWCAALRASSEAAALFVELLCTVAEVPAKHGSIVGDMHEVGLLAAMVPEFAPVMGRVHHDVYHVYTVDIHSIAAVDTLRALARGDLAQEYPLAARLAAEMARPAPLFLATLLHDIGKGFPDVSGSRTGHPAIGASMCQGVLERLGVHPGDIAEARDLVLQHLAMYHAATRRDLDDVGTVEEFCRVVRGREGLRDLYLLTVADVTTTSPTAMTTWKARMLDELYFAADGYLAGHVRGSLEDERTAHASERALAMWTGPAAFFRDYLASMPERYLLANSPEAICIHAQAALDRGARPAHVVRAPSRHPEFAELCVVADDSPGLLSRIAAALTASRLEVLAAQVYSRQLGAGDDGGARVEATDLFWVRDRYDGVDGVDRAMKRLAQALVDVCSGDVGPSELLAVKVGSSPWRERKSPPVKTDVVIDDRASARHTIIEIFAKDRPGLLYTLAAAIHDVGLTITSSKINTEGARVADVFYVSDIHGGKVRKERFKTIREALLRAIEP